MITFRKELYPGQVMWVYFPTCSKTYNTFQLPNGWTITSPYYGADSTNWYRQWAYGVKIPENENPGDYTITYPDGSNKITVKVLPPKNKPRTTISNKMSQKIIQEIINSFSNGCIVDMEPGIYRWTESIDVPDGTEFYGFGVLIKKTENQSNDEFHRKRIFVPRGEMILDGLTIENNGPTMHCWPLLKNKQITVKNCTFNGGNLWHASENDMLVENCKFNSAGTGWTAPNSFYYGNEFIGPNNKGQHPMFIVTNNNLIIRNKFRGTSRGIVLQSGDVENVLALDNRFTEIRGGEGNAGEVILLEGFRKNTNTTGMKNNTFIDTWITDCSGPGISLYGSGMSNNTFWGGLIDVDSVGISVCQLDGNGIVGGEIGTNEFINLEVSGGASVVNNVKPQKFINCHFLKDTVKIGNAGPFTTNYKFLSKNFLREDNNFAKHEFSGCTVIDGYNVNSITSFTDYQNETSK